MGFLKKFENAVRIFRKYGVREFINLSEIRRRFNQERIYKQWIRKIDTLNNDDRNNLRIEITSFQHKPLISIILPVYDVEEKWLRLCIESVRNQLYENWELCIADDFSRGPHIRPLLEEFRDSDERIKVVFRKENGHISAASNSALDLVVGEYTVFLDHDDELSEHALFYVAKEINEHPDTKMIYSDEDLIDTSCRRYGPKFKPDWSRDFFYSANLITHLSCYETSLLRKIGGFTIGMEGSQDYDLALRVIEEIRRSQIRHIPRVLYHWRVLESSVASGGDAKPYAHQAARNAIAAHLERIGKSASVSQTVHNLHRVQYALPDEPPKVSLIFIADEDRDRSLQALNTIADNTEYSNLEIVLICREKSAFEEIAKNGLNGISEIKVIESDLNSEAGLLNRAAKKAEGEVICFSDLELVPSDNQWLKELVSFAIQDEIGAVGAKLLNNDGSILHGGLLMGVGGTVGVAHKGLPGEADGNITRTRLIGNFSAVSVSCMAIRRKLFSDHNGFNEEVFSNRLFDSDLCLRLGDSGLRIVWTPYAKLTSTAKGERLNLQKPIDSQESKIFIKKWKNVIKRDPFHNPNLSKDSTGFEIDVQY